MKILHHVRDIQVDFEAAKWFATGFADFFIESEKFKVYFFLVL